MTAAPHPEVGSNNWIPSSQTLQQLQSALKSAVAVEIEKAMGENEIPVEVTVNVKFKPLIPVDEIKFDISWAISGGHASVL